MSEQARTTGDSDRYRLGRRIATGGMGEVWQSTDVVLGREVAIKLLKSEYADDPTFRSRFEAEARNAAQLAHPNVASVFDVGELRLTEDDTPRPFLVMELVKGEPLSALLRPGEPMPADTAANLLSQAADGLAAAHSLGIVHRDVKPGNLLVTPDGTVKITDFGIARAADAVALTQTGQVIGTPQYLSPEQAQGRPAAPASDIYSLGVVLYECLAGRRPFEADSPIATALAHLREEPPPLPADVPEQLRRSVAVALAKDPADRFPSMRDFADALRGTVAPPTPAATPAAAEPTAFLPAAAVGGVGAAGAAAVGSGTGMTTTSGPATGAPTPAGPPPRQRTPRWVLWLAAAGAVLVVVVLLAWLSNRTGSGGTGGTGTTRNTPSASASTTASHTSSASPSQSSSAPSQVQVTESDYVGQPADQVRDDLHKLGLKVAEHQVDNPGGKQQGTVAGLDPSGKVDPGSLITMSVYGPKPAPTPTTTPTTTPSSSASTATSTPTTPSTTAHGPGPKTSKPPKPGKTKPPKPGKSKPPKPVKPTPGHTKPTGAATTGVTSP